MALEKALVERLQRLEPEAWSGTVYRHILGDRDPLLPNTRGARWNPLGIDALYASLERATAIAEGDYLVAAQPVPLRIKRALHRIRVTLRTAIRLTDRALLRELGIDDMALADADHSACRRVGHAAAWLEHDGLIVPSARAAGLNLVIFVMNLETEPEAVDWEIIDDPAAKR